MSREKARISFKKYAVPKERVKELKRFIRELGYKHMLEKLKKCPNFWFFFDSAYCQFIFYPDDPRIPSPQIDLFRSYFEEFHKKELCEVPNSEEKLSPVDGLGLYYSLPIAVGTIFSPASKIYKSFEPLMETYYNQDYFLSMTKGSHMAAVRAAKAISAVDGHVYGIDWDYTQKIDSATREICFVEYKINRKTPRKKQIKEGNRNINCYELLLNEGVNKIKQRELTFEGKKYPLWIHARALNRVCERLNLQKKSHSYDILVNQSEFENVFKHKKILFIPVVYSLSKREKVGYFIARIIEDECHISTFRFITEIHTPEGGKLNNLLAVNEKESDYLEFTTYNQLLKSDIRDDIYLRELFEQCNLGHLFTINETPEDEYIDSAAFIRKTLMIDEKEPILSRKF